MCISPLGAIAVIFYGKLRPFSPNFVPQARPFIVRFYWHVSVSKVSESTATGTYPKLVDALWRAFEVQLHMLHTVVIGNYADADGAKKNTTCAYVQT